jgi:hypothetical protein
MRANAAGGIGADTSAAASSRPSQSITRSLQVPGPIAEGAPPKADAGADSERA